MLNRRELKRAADALTRRFGLREVTWEEIDGLYTERVPLPVVRESDIVRVWIDRLYISYAERGGPVRYVYITRAHICEESRSYALARRLRKSGVALPEDVKSEFRRALRYMRAAQSDMHLYAAEYVYGRSI